MLLLTHKYAGSVRLRCDLCLGGHVVPQVLEFLIVVIIDVVPRHVVRLGVGALALPLVSIGIAFLVLAQR